MDYLKDMGFEKAQILTGDVQRTLVARAREGDRNAARLLVGCMSKYLIKRACWYQRRYYPHAHMEDYFQTGCRGVLRAIEKFDGSYDNTFSTYSVWWIEMYMRREYYNSHLIRRPEYHYQNYNKIAKVIRNTVILTGHYPTMEEVAKTLSWPIERVERVWDLKLLENMVASEAHANHHNSGEGSVRFYHIPDPALNVNQLIEQAENKAKVHRALKKLDHRDRKILWARANGKTLKSIGLKMGLSRERIRQLESRALKRLATIFGLDEPKSSLKEVNQEQISLV